MLNEKLAEHTGHYPILRGASGRLQRNSPDNNGAADALDHVRGNDGSTGVLTERQRPERQERSALGQERRSISVMVWSRYRATSIYLMTVLTLILIVIVL